MICDAHEVPEDARIDADVAIVGAGPAGITLALELAGSGLAVVLVEGGGPAERFHGEVAAPDRHPPLTLYRGRGLGGTSALWGGRCVPFDPVDFEARPHVPWSGWPFGAGELAPWYERAAKWCEIGMPRFQTVEALGADAGPHVEGFADADIEAEALERFSCPTDFGRRYRHHLERQPGLTVLVGAVCTALETAESGRGIAGLRFATCPGHGFSVRARACVLATGGLETPRLLLACGIGGPLVGRFYMCHIEGKAAVARFPSGRRVAFAYERDGAEVYLRRHFALTAAAQRRLRTTNVILRFEPPPVADPAHRSPILSAVWLSRAVLAPEYARKLAGRPRRGLVQAHLGNVVAGLPAFAGFAADWLWRHSLARRKLPYVAVAGPDGTFCLDYNAEQIPDPDSRVTLADECDGFGLPRLRVEWRATPADLDGVVTAHRVLAAALARSGAGTLSVDEEAIRRDYAAIGGHHIGTARMAADPGRGVVDRHGRVFGVDNLWLAGSAVFPTSSHANPTFTIVALAARLAARLREVL